MYVLGLIIVAALLVLVGRLWMLQLTGWVVYAQAAAAGNRTSVTYSPAPRGIIFDRHGRVLAENRPVWNVSIMPAKFPRDEGKAEKIIVRLAGILQVPTPELREKLKTARARRGQEVATLEDVGEDVPFKTVAQIEEQALPGVGISQSAVRSYPYGSLAAHVLGYARGINDVQFQQVDGLNYWLPPQAQGQEEPTDSDPIYGRDSIFGQLGLEKEYEIQLNTAPPVPILTGRRGRTVYEVDSALTPVRLIEQRAPAVGASVYLTLDAKVQQAAEEGLRAAMSGHPNRTGAAVVIDVDDGGLLAMASQPSFNPNDWVKHIPAAQWKRINDDPRTPMMNKATQGLYPPASTFKLISMTAALDSLKCSPNRTFNCPGSISEGGRVFKCWEHGGHGTLDFRGALARSCDVYFYEVVRKAGLDADTIYKYARDFGLGDYTGLDLPQQSAGQVPNPTWKQKRDKEGWWTGDTLNMVIGQGATTATPLQMALVCATVANGGSLLQPHLLDRIVWPEHLKLPPMIFGRKVRHQVNVRPETLQIVREGMRLAVTAEHGTAGAVRDLPIPVAGKTGSAEHMSDRPPHAWFVCFLPYDKPKYAIAVFVSEGGHGGVTAGPVARRIISALYGLKGAAGGAENATSD